MKAFDTNQIRNIALAGHTGSGKTSLSEAMVWSLKQNDRLGKTDDGSTISDYDPEEQRRRHSIQTSLLPVEYEENKINILDLPGFRDFIGDIKGGIRAAESMVLVYDATGGLDVGAETVVQYADDFERAKVVFINKLDKEHASFEKAFDLLKTEMGLRMVPVTLPVGEALEFKGVIDLIKMKMVVEDDQNVSYQDIPAEMAEEAEAARNELVEAAAEGDDDLMMKFLEEEALTTEEILAGLRGAICQRRIVPVVCGSAMAIKGVRPLINLIAHCLPSPTDSEGIEMTDGAEGEAKMVKVSSDGPAMLHIFKTVIDPYVGRLSFFKVIQGTVKSESSLHNNNINKTERIAHVLFCKGKKSENMNELHAGDMGAVAKLEAAKSGNTLVDPAAGELMVTPLKLPKPTAMMAVKAKTRAEEDKVGMGFHRLIDQDPTLSLRRDASIRQTILSGMGETHLQVAVARLKDLAKVEVDMEIPRVPYRETITKKAQGQGKYKKQSGGHGQYGDCWVRFEPLPEGSGFQFEWEIVGGVIPTNFKTAVEKGLVESLERGILAGSPTVDVKAACYDGSYHAVDSSDMSFKVASSMAFKNVIPSCGPIILEPIYKIKITVPDDHMGDVMGDLNSRRGRILGMNPVGKKQVIEALVPLSEIFVYSRQLNSITQGRGIYEMEYDHFERVPNEVQEKIIEETKRRKEEDEA